MNVLNALVPQLTTLPGVVAVALGGSRARRTHGPDSDWDLGQYYRGSFDATLLTGLGHPGHAAQPGEWGRLPNGGAWLTVDGVAVDVLLRDLDRVEGWWADARAGRFEVDHVEGHLAGLPTYTPVGELAVNQVLYGTLPTVAYPDALRRTARHRWRWGCAFSLEYAAKYARRGDVTLTAGMLAKAAAQAAHAVQAGRGEWVLNEKRLVAAAGLQAVDAVVGACHEDPVGAVERVRELLVPPHLAELARG